MDLLIVQYTCRMWCVFELRGLKNKSEMYHVMRSLGDTYNNRSENNTVVVAVKKAVGKTLLDNC